MRTKRLSTIDIDLNPIKLLIIKIDDADKESFFRQNHQTSTFLQLTSDIVSISIIKQKNEKLTSYLTTITFWNTE